MGYTFLLALAWLQEWHGGKAFIRPALAGPWEQCRGSVLPAHRLEGECKMVPADATTSKVGGKCKNSMCQCL